jgi:hypothetical protein
VQNCFDLQLPIYRLGFARLSVKSMAMKAPLMISPAETADAIVKIMSNMTAPFDSLEAVWRLR